MTEITSSNTDPTAEISPMPSQLKGAGPVSGRGFFKRILLSLLSVLLICLLTLCILAGGVLLEPHTYKKAAKDEAYMQSVQNTVREEVDRIAAQSGVPKRILKQHTAVGFITKMTKQNAADAALVLKGRQVIYNISFDEAALLTDLQIYYGNKSVKSMSDSQRNSLERTASRTADAVNGATRVIDMERIVYDSSLEGPLSWLTFMGGGGIVLCLLLLALVFLLLYRSCPDGIFSRWLCSIAGCAALLELVIAATILIRGLHRLDLEPEALAILCESMVRSVLTECLLLAVIWLAITYVSLRSAMGKPVSLEKFRAFANGRFAKEKDPDASSQDLGQVVKKAASDSLETILWRRRR